MKENVVMTRWVLGGSPLALLWFSFTGSPAGREGGDQETSRTALQSPLHHGLAGC